LEKIEKEKVENKINYKRGQGHRFGPAKKQAHGPSSKFLNRYQILPFSG
jgi:hypothetical protein